MGHNSKIKTQVCPTCQNHNQVKIYFSMKFIGICCVIRSAVFGSFNDLMSYLEGARYCNFAHTLSTFELISKNLLCYGFEKVSIGCSCFNLIQFKVDSYRSC